jgi:hypothetical protein
MTLLSDLPLPPSQEECRWRPNWVEVENHAVRASLYAFTEHACAR